MLLTRSEWWRINRTREIRLDFTAYIMAIKLIHQATTHDNIPEKNFV